MSEDPKTPKSTDEQKKDLTGIFDLPQAEALPDEEKDPFAVNELQQVEQIESFDSIDSLGMMDHPTEESAPENPAEPAIREATPELPSDPFALAANEVHADPFALPQEPLSADPIEDAAPPMDFLENIKSYSEKARETAFDPGARYPFHLLIQGDFDPYARDKLLLFITENPIGTNSSELDLQIQGGRVLFPHISEFAGIKLIQELRDSGLSFSLSPSPLDADEITPTAPALTLHYSDQNQTETRPAFVIPVLRKENIDQKVYQVIDTIQMVQFLKAEILEVEKSELFQELLDRMTSALKRKANTLGGSALTELHHQITPLRLPSQYQIELSATVLKKL